MKDNKLHLLTHAIKFTNLSHTRLRVQQRRLFHVGVLLLLLFIIIILDAQRYRYKNV